MPCSFIWTSSHIKLVSKAPASRRIRVYHRSPRQGVNCTATVPARRDTPPGWPWSMTRCVGSLVRLVPCRQAPTAVLLRVALCRAALLPRAALPPHCRLVHTAAPLAFPTHVAADHPVPSLYQLQAHGVTGAADTCRQGCVAAGALTQQTDCGMPQCCPKSRAQCWTHHWASNHVRRPRPRRRPLPPPAPSVRGPQCDGDGRRVPLPQAGMRPGGGHAHTLAPCRKRLRSERRPSLSCPLSSAGMPQCRCAAGWASQPFCVPACAARRRTSSTRATGGWRGGGCA